MQPRKVANLIKRAGESWVLLREGTEAGRFSGVLPTGKTTLSVAEVTLEAGDIVSRARDPRTLFLVTDTASNRYYSKATLAKVNAYADLYRFTEGPRDSFGRVADFAPVLVAAKLPLYRHSSTTSTEQRGPDRSSTKAEYAFTASGAAEIRPQDRLTLGSVSVVVVSVRLTAEGLVEFTAVAEA